MRQAWSWSVGLGLAVSAVCSPPLAAQESDVCALATSEEFQRAYGVDPRIGLIPDEPAETQMTWGPHCDYSPGSITLFTKKSPGADLDRVLEMTKADKQRVPVQGLGQRAFFTVIYPDDKYKRGGLLAVFLGSKVVAITMDAHEDKPVAETRPKLEGLAKLVVPRVE
jgi:hypothetical protein